MNLTLVKAIVGLIVTGAMLWLSLVEFIGRRTLGPLLQLLGATCLVVMVATHIFEALDVFASMGWGHEHSSGHYLDLVSAALGVTLFSIGYVIAKQDRTRRI